MTSTLLRSDRIVLFCQALLCGLLGQALQRPFSIIEKAALSGLVIAVYFLSAAFEDMRLEPEVDYKKLCSELNKK